jgi:hypothetical protein
MLEAMQDKHVHICEYERKDRLFTGLIVCTTRDVYLSSKDRPLAQEKASPKPETQTQA